MSTEENALKLLLSVMAQVAFESIQMAKKVTLNGELLSDIAEICKTYIQNESLVRKALKVVVSCGAVGMNLTQAITL